MDLIKIESNNVEFKERWQDDYLKWICGFANTQGGVLYVGISDNGDICGVENPKKLMEDIPNKVRDLLESYNIRVELDDRNEKIGKKIREAQLEKIPYMVVVGDKEVEENKVALRHRKEGDKGAIDLNDFVAMLLAEINSKEIK